MIVLDASALVDLLLRRPEGDEVLELISAHDVIAPTHQQVETLSALWRLERTGDMSTTDFERLSGDALTVRQELVALSPALLRRAATLRGRVRVSDGVYVALAEERGCPLVTTDRRLARADVPCEVIVPPAASGPSRSGT